MTYHTTKHTPANVMITANIPEAPKPKPTMTWAEMAKAEGHRKGVPRSMAEEVLTLDEARDERLTAVASVARNRKAYEPTEQRNSGRKITASTVSSVRGISIDAARKWVDEAVGAGILRRYGNAPNQDEYALISGKALKALDRRREVRAESKTVVGKILGFLRETKKATAPDIASAMGSTTQSVSQRLSRMKRRGDVFSKDTGGQFLVWSLSEKNRRKGG